MTSRCMHGIQSHVAGGTLQWKSVTGLFDQHGSCVSSELLLMWSRMLECQEIIVTLFHNNCVFELQTQNQQPPLPVQTYERAE